MELVQFEVLQAFAYIYLNLFLLLFFQLFCLSVAGHGGLWSTGTSLVIQNNLYEKEYGTVAIEVRKPQLGRRNQW